jgi:hypothetical protein
MAVFGDNHMPNRCPGGRPPRMAGHPRPLALVAVGASVCLLGCATAGHRARASTALVAGRRAGPIPAAQLAPATSLARRFADAYANSVYLAPPPPLPGATRAVEHHLLLAAARVPAERRGHHPFAGRVVFEALSPTVLAASVTVEDARAPSFSVGFTVNRVGRRWRVVAISPPS